MKSKSPKRPQLKPLPEPALDRIRGGTSEWGGVRDPTPPGGGM